MKQDTENKIESKKNEERNKERKKEEYMMKERKQKCKQMRKTMDKYRYQWSFTARHINICFCHGLFPILDQIGHGDNIGLFPKNPALD